MKTKSQGSIRVIAMLAGLFALVACETDLSTLNGGSPDPGTPTGTATPAVLGLIASSPQLSSASSAQSSGVTITALAKDSGNRPVSGATVVFTVDNNALITTIQGTTDANGTAQAVVTTGGDPSNRTLTIGAQSGNATGSVIVNVVGTTLSITGPASAQFGQAAAYVVSLLNSAGQGIAGRTVTISSADAQTLSANSLSTNVSGQATFNYTVSNNNPSPDTLTAAALGIGATIDVVTSASDSFTITAPLASPAPSNDVPLNTDRTVTLRWLRNGSGVNGKTISFASTRGVLSASSAVTDVNGNASVTIRSTSAGTATIQAYHSVVGEEQETTRRIEFIATVPAKINVQANPAVILTNASSDITATVRDAADNLVKNAEVTFSLTDVTGGLISAPKATTNSQGTAKVVYSSSSTPSSTDGVSITARVGTPSINDNTQLTVGGRAARIVLGTGNEITEPNQTTYKFPYSVIVTDNNGAAISDAEVFLSIEPISYDKGDYGTDPDDPTKKALLISASCLNEDINKNGVLDGSEDKDCDGVLDVGEDTNNNGSLDLGEDINGNCELDPSNVASVLGSVRTGTDGSIQFDITYPQDRGNWLTVKLTARTTVSGSETRESVVFTLPISAADVPNPPGSPSPYGEAAVCTDPN